MSVLKKFSAASVLVPIYCAVRMWLAIVSQFFCVGCGAAVRMLVCRILGTVWMIGPFKWHSTATLILHNDVAIRMDLDVGDVRMSHVSIFIVRIPFAVFFLV